MGKFLQIEMNKSVKLQIRKFELSGKVPANRDEYAKGLMLSLGLT